MRNLLISAVVLFMTSLFSSNSFSLEDGDDIMYGAKSVSGSVQNWGTLAPSSGNFTAIGQISPTGLGWPLGDIGSQPDPINGYVFTRQTNSETLSADILAIKKSDASTKWLGLTNNDVVMGYDTKNNLLIIRRSADSLNKILSYNMSTSETSTISSSFADGNINWQAGGNNAIDSYGRIAYTFRGTTLYKINLDDATEESVTLDDTPVSIAWDSKNKKLYAVTNSNIVSIDTSSGDYTVVSSGTVPSTANYVQLIAPNDQRYYIQGSDVTRVFSLTDGSLLGSFASILRLMPPGAVVVGDDDTDQTISMDIADPSSTLIKLGDNTVTYTGTSVSSGITAVDEGTLSVNGSIENSTSNVSVGATLEGIGTIGGINNSGTVAPGNSIGTLTVSGNTVFNSNSILVIEVDTAGNSDKIISSGSVAIDGTLRVSPSSGSYTGNNTYTFLTGSSISGTFSNITVLSCSGTVTPTYNSTSVTFTLSNCSTGASYNRDSITSYVNDLSASGDLSSFINSLNSLSGRAYNNSIETLDYHSYGAVLSVLRNNSQNIIDNIIARALYRKNNLGWWSDVYGEAGNRRSLTNLNTPGYDYTSLGTAIGYSKSNQGDLDTLYFNYNRGSLKLNKDEGSSNYESFVLSYLKLMAFSDNKKFTYTGSFGITTVDSSRHIKLTSLNRIASSNHNVFTLDASGSYSLDNLTFLNNNYSLRFDSGLWASHSESFSETGANSVNLHVNNKNVVNTRFGINVIKHFNQFYNLKPSLMIGYNVSKYINGSSITQSFVGNSSFNTKYDQDTNNHALISLDITNDINSDFKLNFKTSLRASDKGNNVNMNFEFIKPF